MLEQHPQCGYLCQLFLNVEEVRFCPDFHSHCCTFFNNLAKGLIISANMDIKSWRKINAEEI